MTKKIDIHTHLTRNELWGLYTTNASPEHLIKEMDKFNIKKSVVMATYFPHKKKGIGNNQMLELVKPFDRFLVFGSLDVENNLIGGINELENLIANKKIAGIKLYPGYQKFYPNEKKLYPIYKLAQTYNLPVTFHAGETTQEGNFPESWEIDEDHPEKYHQFRTHPSHMANVAKKFSQIKIIISHYGQPFTKSVRLILNKHKNIYTDVSGLWKTGKDDTPREKKQTKNALVKLAKECNINQILFGSDFPIQSIEDSISHIENMNLSKQDQKKVFYENAKGILKL